MKSVEELLIEEEYNDCRIWINKAREKKKTWEEISFGCSQNDDGLKLFIQNKCDNDFWTITCEEWKLLVNEIKKVEEQSMDGFIGEPQKAWISVPESNGSCWQNYKSKLHIFYNYTNQKSKNNC